MKTKCLILIFLSSVMFLASIPTSFQQGTQRVFMWWQTSFGKEISSVSSWCTDIGVTDLAVYGYLSPGEIDTIQADGLGVWYINIFGATNNTEDWNAYTLAVNTTISTYGYDGVLFDDTQMLWYTARNNGTVDDLVYYQQFCNNVSANIVPTVGSNYVIAEMSAYGDETDWNDMKNLNITNFIFSYYYEPDPRSTYYRPGITQNMTVNAWNITGYYDDWGLNTYYKYQGWIWLENYWSEPSTSTLSIVKTYNSIVDLYGNYTANDLMLYNVYQLFQVNRLKNEALLMDIITAWKSHIKIAENKILLQDFDTFYWSEEFTSIPFNQTELSSDNWQTWSNAEGNYSMEIVGTSYEKYLGIFYNGTNNSGAAQYQTLERLLECSEEADSIKVNFTPLNRTSSKIFIIKGIYPLGAFGYQIVFQYGNEGRIYLTYRNASAYAETTVYASMNWTIGTSYTLTYNLNETNSIISINNGTSTWTYSVEAIEIQYNSNRLYSFYIVDQTNHYGAPSLDNLSMKINYVHVDPLRDYIDVSSWLEGDVTATIETNTDLEVYFANIGMSPDVTVYSKTYEREINHTDVGSYSFRFNMTYIDEEFTIAFGITPILPFGFIMGMVGLGSMFGGSMWAIKKVKDREINEAVTEGFIIAIIGVALFIAWLWGA